MTLLRLIALSCVLVAGPARAQNIDFVSADGPDRTCPKYLALDPARLPTPSATPSTSRAKRPRVSGPTTSAASASTTPW
jgi:hypothetical protein